MDPLAYHPGETLDQYLTEQQAAFVPQHVAATPEQISGDENYVDVTPAQAAYDTTYNKDFGAQDWYKAQEQDALKNLPAGWSGGTYGTDSEGSPIYLPGTGPTSGKNMAYRPLGNNQYQIQEYGPNGLIGDASTVDMGLGTDPLFGALVQAGSAALLGPLAGQLGALAAPGLGAGAQMAIGQGLVGAGKTAAMGGDLGDALTSGLTSGATSFIGSAIGDALPKGVAPTGIQSLDTALTKGMQSAAGSGVTSLLTGNKNILQDALIAGAGAAAGSGANSVISDAAGSTGLPPAALNIIGPAAIAELMGKDPTGYALKAAVGEITGAIKGSSADAKQTTPGVAAPKDLMSGITEPGEYPQDDGSVLSVARPEKGVNAGKLVGNLYSKEDVAKDVNSTITQDFGVNPINLDGRPLATKDDTVQSLLDRGFVPSLSGDDVGVLQNQPKTTENPPSDFGLDFGAFAEQPEASAYTTPKVEVTGQTPDTELMRFLEANGFTSDEAQKVLISGKDQDAGTDYSKFFELGPEGTPTPKVVVQGEAPAKETPPASSSMDELMSLLSPNDKTQKVEVAGTTPKEPLPTDAGLDLGAYNEGPAVVAPDKLTDDLTQEVEITGQTPNIPLDYSSLENGPKEFPYIYPGEETPPEVKPEEPGVDPTKPVVKPVIPKVPVVTPPGTTTTPGSSYTIPGTTTQLHQDLMQLPETDILRMLNPALYAYNDAQKRKKLSQEDQMMALLNELGYRS